MHCRRCERCRRACTSGVDDKTRTRFCVWCAGKCGSGPSSVPKALACLPKPKRIPPRRRPPRKHLSSPLPLPLALALAPSRTPSAPARPRSSLIVRAHHHRPTAAPLPAGRAPSLPASIRGTRTSRIGQLQPPSDITAATSSQPEHGQSRSMKIVRYIIKALPKV